MSEDTAILALLDFLDALEAGVAAAKHRIKEAKLSDDTWDPSKIQWTAAEGPKGSYEKAVQQGSKDYKAAVLDLEAHHSSITRDNLYYWLFSDGDAIGRKPRRQP